MRSRMGPPGSAQQLRSERAGAGGESCGEPASRASILLRGAGMFLRLVLPDVLVRLASCVRFAVDRLPGEVLPGLLTTGPVQVLVELGSEALQGRLGPGDRRGVARRGLSVVLERSLQGVDLLRLRLGLRLVPI